jgi:hypothetical protein
MPYQHGAHASQYVYFDGVPRLRKVMGWHTGLCVDGDERWKLLLLAL